MKKNQEELLNTIENVLSTLSSEYIVDMFLTDYNKPYWLNRPSINKNTYLDNTINTYTLIEQAKCIVGFSSTSIVEAVALNKPAIIVSDVYYSNFGIVYQANNKQEYYNFLKDAESNLLKIDETMIERAYISNYITQSCNWQHTIFTPHRSDFLKWSQKNIYDISEVSLLVDVILNEMPISLLQHKKNFND